MYTALESYHYIEIYIELVPLPLLIASTV